MRLNYLLIGSFILVALIPLIIISYVTFTSSSQALENTELRAIQENICEDVTMDSCVCLRVLETKHVSTFEDLVDVRPYHGAADPRLTSRSRMYSNSGYR